ncbi:MAG: 50S ribosomal protein L24 [Nanoarchaeota archaeon]
MKDPGKQRKAQQNLPNHRKGKKLHAHLSKELRTQYKTRAIRLRTGDKVKIMRGNFRGKSGKVDHVNTSKSTVCLTGFEAIRKDGTKNMLPFTPSNLLITELTMTDQRRKKRVEKNAKATS